MIIWFLQPNPPPSLAQRYRWARWLSRLCVFLLLAIFAAILWTMGG